LIAKTNPNEMIELQFFHFFQFLLNIVCDFWKDCALQNLNIHSLRLRFAEARLQTIASKKL